MFSGLSSREQHVYNHQLPSFQNHSHLLFRIGIQKSKLLPPGNGPLRYFPNTASSFWNTPSHSGCTHRCHLLILRSHLRYHRLREPFSGLPVKSNVISATSSFTLRRTLHFLQRPCHYLVTLTMFLFLVSSALVRCKLLVGTSSAVPHCSILSLGYRVCVMS